jgi:maleamate amidohydrolase
VRATTVDAFSYGFRTILPEDCIGDQGRDAHESNLRDVHRRYAEVTSSDEVIAYLERLPQLATA